MVVSRRFPPSLPTDLHHIKNMSDLVTWDTWQCLEGPYDPSVALIILNQPIPSPESLIKLWVNSESLFFLEQHATRQTDKAIDTKQHPTIFVLMVEPIDLCNVSPTIPIDCITSRMPFVETLTRWIARLALTIPPS